MKKPNRKSLTELARKIYKITAQHFGEPVDSNVTAQIGETWFMFVAELLAECMRRIAAPARRGMIRT